MCYTVFIATKELYMQQRYIVLQQFVNADEGEDYVLQDTLTGEKRLLEGCILLDLEVLDEAEWEEMGVWED